jgi:hypothetical protein
MKTMNRIERQRKIKHYADQITEIQETDSTLNRWHRIANLLELFGVDCDADNAPTPVLCGCRSAETAETIPSGIPIGQQPSKAAGLRKVRGKV